MATEGGATRSMSPREQDIHMMLAADVHLGTKNCDFQMDRYVYKRRTDVWSHKPEPTAMIMDIGEHQKVDLFFYRDPEEAKEQEEEEALVAPDYGAVAEYTAPAADTWGGEWGADAAAPPAAVPAQAGADWTAAPAPAAGGWDMAAAPAAPVAAPGWEQGSAPAPATAPNPNWE
ncbi:hypothetical protein ABZP36_002173 [Zizania latifolia]